MGMNLRKGYLVQRANCLAGSFETVPIEGRSTKQKGSEETTMVMRTHISFHFLVILDVPLSDGFRVDAPKQHCLSSGRRDAQQPCKAQNPGIDE